MSSAPTSASGSTFPRRQFSKPPASVHGDATRTDPAPAMATSDPESAGGRALNPLAKVFIPAAEEASSTPKNPAADYPSSEPSMHGGVTLKPAAESEHAAGLSAAFSQQQQTGRGSVQIAGHNSGRRGHTFNANHLLNFQYDPIVRSSPSSRPPPARRHHHKVQAYDKELFLQANFRFLVSDFGDYLENSTDPDKMLQWQDIALVELSSPVEIRCPICLDAPPLCPQITSCGHVFCFPCILRYFTGAGEDNKADYHKKCPLCFTVTSCKQLRTVHIHDVKQTTVGETINFTLLTRSKGSVIPQQRDGVWGSPAYSKDGRCHLYSKFTLTSDIDKTTNDAISDLTAWAVRAQGGDEEELAQLPFVFGAIDELKLRKAAWEEHRTLEFMSSSPPMRQRFMEQAKAGITRLPAGGGGGGGNCAEVPSTVPKKGPVYHLNPFSDELELVAGTSPKEGEGVPESASTEHQEHVETDTYSFYQAADGQLIVMHPLSMKCLVHHHGSHKNLPQSVQGKVLEMESVIQTEASRRRYRFLSHLPLTSIFQLCEVDLSETIPRASMSPFREEIKARQARRQRRLKQEKMLKSAEERAEEKQVPPSPEDYIAIMNVLHDNEVPGAADFADSVVAAPPIVVTPPVDDRRLFSNVAKLGFAAGHDAPDLVIDGPRTPTLKQSAEAGTSSSAGRSFADITQRAKEKSQEPSARVSNKGKKSQKILLSTSGGRKYSK